MAEAKDLQDKAYEAVEIAKKTGKLKKGSNEATKIIERGIAKLVLIAEDTSPKEIIMHLAPLCEEKQVPCVTVSSKEELGAAAGLDVATTAVVIINEGDAREIIKQLKEKLAKK
ncbi:MAG: 50S ribosomal protein L7Ae [Nanoarchaeota archaeon]|nr:50S ribosomal protein L7Ae [Nanoarchaeota archaeon]